MISPDENCEYCDGTGEVDVYESVWAGEYPMALVGSQRCSCTYDEHDE